MTLYSPRRTVCLLLALSLSATAQDRTTAEGEAKILDPAKECEAYGSDIITNNKAKFPAPDVVADILVNDAEAHSKYNSILPSIPKDVKVKIPTDPKDFSSPLNFASYDLVNDPDCWWSALGCTKPKHSGLKEDLSTVPEPNTLGYGFDDGPYCGHNQFYNYLSRNNQTATMFYIGTKVMYFPLEAQRAKLDGHEICVHTWSHNRMTTLNNTAAFAELWYTMKIIKLVVGVTPTCWRPPQGDVDDRIRAIAAGLNLRNILWTYDSNDWRNGINGVTSKDVDGNYTELVNAAKNGTFKSRGTILLAHENSLYTMQTAMDWYPKIKAAFKYLVPVGIALNLTQPYAETSVTFPTFEKFISNQSSNSSSSGAKTSGKEASGSQTPSSNAKILLASHLGFLLAIMMSVSTLILI